MSDVVAVSTGSKDYLPLLQALLAAEHAAVYGYGIVGARTTGAQRQQAQAAFVAHRARRDRLIALVRDAGGEPVAAAPGYELPEPVTDAASAARLAAHLELGVAAADIDLVAVAPPELRSDVALDVQACAVRAAQWSGSPTAFPGLPAADQTSPE
jgi:hypothetical protein